MATVQPPNRLALPAQLRHPAADRGPGALGRRLLGAVLLLLGILMTSTLLLLPVGLPLALLAVALIAAPGSP
jgi:hypothetical protein